MGYNLFLLLTVILVSSCCLISLAIEVSYDNRAIKIDGERKILISGAIHYPRSTPQMWPDLIQKAKEGGLDTIETYIFWNGHEPLYRQYDFSGRYDFIKYIKTIQDAGLYVILRIGPYVCAEWNYGGFPVWLHNLPNITFRTDNEVFKNEMKIFTTKIVDMVKQESLFASQGGPIILAQIENEYGNIMSSYGEEGKKYIKWCADFAVSLNIGVPWIMCQQDDAPPSMISTCNGFYCDQFQPKNPNIPKMWTENWSGWYNDWGQKHPHRTAEDLAFAVARFYQTGGTLQNYYMYHGGTNFDRTAGGPLITTSYDYDAPLDEYGNLNQPKWGHLKELHLILKANEKILTYGTVTNNNYDSVMSSTIFELNGTKLCFIGNAHSDKDMTVEVLGNKFAVPAWSATILQDCKKEIYNTARVNTQTSVAVKNPSSSTFNWSYKFETPEHYKDPTRKFLGKGDGFLADYCPDQKKANDTSDYLWYMNSVRVEENDPILGGDITLHVHTDGPVLHVFVNGKHIGTNWGKNGKSEFVFEHLVNLKPGKKNLISLLSVGVGLQNYGAYFDEGRNGIHGPVRLATPNGHVKNLTLSQWEIRSGLDGLDKKLYLGELGHAWNSDYLPINKEFVWYKTSFDSPRGLEPVVLDLLGMGKGSAWVNGHNIGRYWPSYYADDNGCNSTCDYRGAYSGDKCPWNCGKSTQRWYHVPRSFLRDEGNTLVLFEEFGGNPSGVGVETVVTGQICANAYEGTTLELSCQQERFVYGGDSKYRTLGRVISDVKFASFGDPTGACGVFETPFKKGSCDSPNTLSFIKQACVGRVSCSIDVSEKSFGASGCKNDINKRLVVAASC